MGNIDIDKIDVKNTIETWQQHPELFIEDVLGWKPWEKQLEICREYVKSNRITVKSGNGLGKTRIVAGIVLAHLHTYPNSKVITTAPTWALVQNVLWAEIRSQHKNAKLPLGSTCLDTYLKTFDPEHYAIGMSTDEGDRIKGFHSPHVLVIVDEASGVSDEILDALEELMTGDHAKMIYIGNPTNTSGKYYKSFYDPNYSCLFKQVSISCYDSPNVKQGRDVIPGLVGLRWIEERKKEYGENSAWYQSHVLGEFPVESEDQLISPLWVKDAENKEIELYQTNPIILSIDVARLGDDSTVFLIRQGNKVIDIQSFNGKRIDEIVGRSIMLEKEYTPDLIVVDDTGVGGGVTDYLMRFNTIGFVAKNSSNDSDRFSNIRAEYYWKLKCKFENGKISIPDNNKLKSELTCIKVKYLDNGQIQMQSKKDMKKSPDFADALMMSEFGIEIMGFKETKRLPMVYMPGITTFTKNSNFINGGSSRTGYG